MNDRISLFPGRVTLTPVAGQANTYDMARADQPTQEGSALNKAFFLPDELAAALGIEADDPKVADALRALLDINGETVAAMPKVVVGTYTGAGKYGSSNKNSLNVGFAPKIVIVSSESNGLRLTYASSYVHWQNSFLWVNNPTSANVSAGGNNASLSFSTSGNTLYWYSSSSAGHQLNTSGTVYHYTVIG